MVLGQTLPDAEVWALGNLNVVSKYRIADAASLEARRGTDAAVIWRVLQLQMTYSIHSLRSKNQNQCQDLIESNTKGDLQGMS
eukprot:scaffold3435_cov57-Cylindrotheca_fusiformis.AAC.2